MSVRTIVVTSLCVLSAASLVACGSGDSPTDNPQSGISPTAKPSATEPPCPEGAHCFDFTTDAEGWPEVNDDNHFAGRDSYLDGTYRIGARQPGSWSLDAPLHVSDLAQDYGVQIDTDATLGQSFPDDAAWGATCWTKPLGHDRVAGFAVYVQPGVETLGLFDENTGAFKPLKQHRGDGLVKPGDKTHLTLRCSQDTSSGAVTAKIEAELKGAPTLSISYADSVKNYGWQPGDGIGLLAAGKGADVFYDHVVIGPRVTSQ